MIKPPIKAGMTPIRVERSRSAAGDERPGGMRGPDSSGLA